MRKAAVAALALSATAAVVAAAFWVRPPQPPPAPAAAPFADADETAALAASNGLAWRDGPALSLRLKSGEVLSLTDHLNCGDLPCPPDLTTQYRFMGWDTRNGGYLLKVVPGTAPVMLLAFADEDPVLVDARHAPAAEGPMALPPPPPAAESDESLGEWLTDVANGRSQSEAPLIAASRGKARRDGARLVLRLDDGREFALSDDLACGQTPCPPQVFRSFDYAGASPDGRFHVVEEHWDEASAAILVDARSGATTALLGPPKFSPDGQRAIATVTDLEWSAPRRLEIWTLGGAKPGIEFSLPAKDEDDTVYEVVAWHDADHVRLRRGPWASPQRSEVMLAHDGGGWRLEAAEANN